MLEYEKYEGIELKKLGYILLIFIMGVFSGCGQSAATEEVTENKDEIVIVVGSEPDEGFDPCVGWGRYGSPLIQSTLVETDVNMNIVMDLATSYEVSEDGLVWIFTLREDAYFTDGEQVHADDVVFTFETAKDSGSIVDLSTMEGVREVDEFTVEFILKEPQSAFIYTIVATGIVPAHAYGDDYAENPIGSGPFVFVQWDKGQQVILTANEEYYGEVAAMKKVTILFMSEDATFIAAKEGILDVALTTANFANQEIEGMTLQQVSSIDNRGITLPMTAEEGETTEDGYLIGNDVTSDWYIRTALSYGINREQLIEEVLNGYGTVAYTECDGMPWSSDLTIPYDLEQAKDILAEGNWIDTDGDGILEKEGVKAEFNLLYSAGDSTRQALAVALQQQVKELGIAITISGLSWDEIDKRMYSDAVIMGWGAQNPLETYLLYHSDNMGRDYYNPEYYTNESVDEIIDMALSEMDYEVSLSYWKMVQSNEGIGVFHDMPWVWLVNVDHLYYVKDGLDMGEQKIQPHGHSWPIVSNLKEWKWES